MLKPQPPQQTSQPQQPPPTQQAVARRSPGGTSPPNGGLPGPLTATAAPPGPPAAVSPCLGPAAAAGSGLRRGAESILAASAPPQHQERPGAVAIGSVRGQTTGKGPPQSPVFEGVYNNSRMLHFLTAVVGSTCDVKVKNGTTYEGIFKTLSSKFELAVDAVHRKASEPAGGPRREDIVDTMVFKPSDVLLVHFRNVDFNYATKDKFTDSAIAMNSKVNGEHKEKVLQRWEGGDSNSDDYDLESDMSNGWDPNEMFKFNEENYGVKTTYDSSLSSYTVPLEKDNSEEFRQRELRAAQLAREIESSPQYRLRIAMENDDGRTEEEKHSAVQRQGSGRESPSLVSREGKYIPLPQRVREGPRGGVRCSSSRGGRPGLSSLPPRGPHHLDNSSPGPGSEARGINGGPSRMSPKAQRPLRGAKTLSSPSNRPSGEASVPPTSAALPFLPVGRMYPPRSPKSAAPAPVSASCPEPPIGSAVASSASIPVTSSVVDPGAGSISPASPKLSLTPTDVKELPTKEPSRNLEAQELARIAGKVPGLQNEQKRFQLEELRKFGAQFKLQPSSSPETGLDPFPSRILKEEAKGKEKEVDGLLTSDPMGSPVSSKTESILDKEDKVPMAGVGGTEGPEQLPAPCPSQTGSPPVGLIKGDEKEEGPVTEQVKKSTLNPNAKEFNPTKPLLSVNKSTSTPTSPGPRTHSTPSIPVLTAGQSGLYSPQYISYIPQIHMGPAVQAPQMYPYPVSNSVPGQQGKYRGAKGSLPPQRSDQHQPASAPPMMQAAAAAAGPPLVAATPYSSYIPYNPQQFPGQPAMMQPMAHYPSQPVFAPMLQSNPRMLTSGSHPQAIVSSSTPQYPAAEQPTPQALYATVHQSYPHHATQLHGHQPQPATTPTGSQPQSQHAAPSPVQAGQAPHLGRRSMAGLGRLDPGPRTVMPAWKREILERRRAKLAALSGGQGSGAAPDGPNERLVLAESLGPLSQNPFMRLESERRRGTRPAQQLLELYCRVPGVRTIRADNILIIESAPGFPPAVPPAAGIRAAEVVVYEAPQPGRVSRLLEKFDSPAAPCRRGSPERFRPALPQLPVASASAATRTPTNRSLAPASPVRLSQPAPPISPVPVAQRAGQRSACCEPAHPDGTAGPGARRSDFLQKTGSNSFTVHPRGLPRSAVNRSLSNGPMTQESPTGPANGLSGSPPVPGKWKPKVESKEPSLHPPPSPGTPSATSVGPPAFPAPSPASATPSQRQWVSSATSANDSFEIRPSSKPDMETIPIGDLQARALANLRVNSRNSFVLIPKRKAPGNYPLAGRQFEEPKGEVGWASQSQGLGSQLVSTVDGAPALEKSPLAAEMQWAVRKGACPRPAISDTDKCVRWQRPASPPPFLPATAEAEPAEGLGVPGLAKNGQEPVRPGLPVTFIDEVDSEEEAFQEAKLPSSAVGVPSQYHLHPARPGHTSELLNRGSNTFTVVPKRKPGTLQEPHLSQTNGQSQQGAEEQDAESLSGPHTTLENTLKKRYPTVHEIEVIGGYLALQKSCLIKAGSSRKKMKISFNDKSLHTTFEYPSESSLAQEEAEEEEEEEGEEDGEEEEVGPDSEKPFTVFLPRATFVSSVGPESSSGLSSYTPKHSMAFSKWQEQTLVQTPTDVELPPKEVMLTPASQNDLSDFRSEPALYF